MCVCDRKLPQNVNDKNVMMSEKQTSSAQYQLRPASAVVQRSVDGGEKGQQCRLLLQEVEVGGGCGVGMGQTLQPQPTPGHIFPYLLFPS